MMTELYDPKPHRKAGKDVRMLCEEYGRSKEKGLGLPSALVATFPTVCISCSSSGLKSSEALRDILGKVFATALAAIAEVLPPVRTGIRGTLSKLVVFIDNPQRTTSRRVGQTLGPTRWATSSRPHRAHTEYSLKKLLNNVRCRAIAVIKMEWLVLV